MKRIYIAGPMTGLPNFNYAAFHAAAAQLRRLGFDAVNPAELAPETNTPWAECMRLAIAALLTCQQVALLPGWHNSRGALLEQDIARKLGMPTREISDFLAEPTPS